MRPIGFLRKQTYPAEGNVVHHAIRERPIGTGFSQGQHTAVKRLGGYTSALLESNRLLSDIRRGEGTSGSPRPGTTSSLGYLGKTSGSHPGCPIMTYQIDITAR